MAGPALRIRACHFGYRHGLKNMCCQRTVTGPWRESKPMDCSVADVPTGQFESDILPVRKECSQDQRITSGAYIFGIESNI